MNQLRTAIDIFVMAITSAERVVRHDATSHDAGDFRVKQGKLIMIALVTFAFLAPALALPGLVTLVMNGATETR